MARNAVSASKLLEQAGSSVDLFKTPKRAIQFEDVWLHLIFSGELMLWFTKLSLPCLVSGCTLQAWRIAQLIAHASQEVYSTTTAADSHVSAEER